METPWLLQWILSAFMLFFIPAYTINYGWRNFLWFSDLMFILTYVGIMTSSLLIVSMAAVGGMLFELAWAILFFLQWIFGIKLPLPGFVDYMFDPKIPLWLRLVSLFHLFMPVFWIWALIVYGYDVRAWKYEILLLWSALAVTWLVTEPVANVNWVYEYKVNPRITVGAFPYLSVGFLTVGLLVGITHILFLLIFKHS